MYFVHAHDWSQLAAAHERRQSQEAAGETDFHFEIVFVHEEQFSRETVGGPRVREQ
jgi:hypothetical protein